MTQIRKIFTDQILKSAFIRLLSVICDPINKKSRLITETGKVELFHSFRVAGCNANK